MRQPLTWVLASGTEVGGAERSLLETLPEGSALFLLPGEGSLQKLVAHFGHRSERISIPSVLEDPTCSRGKRQVLQLFPLLWQLPLDIIRLYRRLHFPSSPANVMVVSLGVRSHIRLLLLAPWLGPKLLFDIRDFIRPKGIRSLIRFMAKAFGCKIRTNSLAVSQDYPGSEVVYPQVKWTRSIVPKQSAKPPWIVAHVAFFAPYKGQDLFLDLAAQFLADGMEAQFWMVGDVIYPGEEYTEYAKKLYARAEQSDLQGRVKFFGRVEDVQGVLEQVNLLLHCTREPEPFGRVLIEALQCGCEVVCHQGSGACETLSVTRDFPGWMQPLASRLSSEYVRVGHKVG